MQLVSHKLSEMSSDGGFICYADCTEIWKMVEILWTLLDIHAASSIKDLSSL